MTSERDFDRIARAWLDVGPNEAPDRSIDAILDAIESLPQVRRPWRWPFWRPTTMTRITMLAVLAGTIAIIIGGLALSGGAFGPGPSPVPSATPAAIASPSPGPLPDALVGGWVAPSRGTPSEDADLTVLTMGGLDGNADAVDLAIARLGFAPILASAITEVAPSVIEIRSSNANGGCQEGDVGRYGWSVSPDGSQMGLTVESDACERRRVILPGTWQRSLAFDSHGGPGIVTNFQPYLEFTLPAGTYVGNGAADTDTINIDAPSLSFKVWKDLDGFVDPCDIDAGRLDLDPGMDGFLAYLTGDPRFTVTSQEEFQIDGHRAVEVQFRIGDSISPPCWDFDGNPNDRTGVLTWNPHAGGAGGFWNAPIASPGMVVVTEVDGTALVFEPVKPSGSTWVIDREVLDTVRFTNELPTPPAS